MPKIVVVAVVLIGTWGIGSSVWAQAANEDGTGFAGAYAPSKIWQPPTDPLALEKLKTSSRQPTARRLMQRLLARLVSGCRPWPVSSMTKAGPRGARVWGKLWAQRDSRPLQSKETEKFPPLMRGPSKDYAGPL